MTKIGIVCAMSEEAQKISLAFDLQKTNNICNYPVYENKSIVLIESSIGKVASTLATTILIEKYHVNKLINIGLAGGLKKIPTGKAYFVKSVTQHDSFIPFEQYQQDMYQTIECEIPENEKSITLTTGDKFINNIQNVSVDADIVDMEGFAVAYVANKYNVPISIIKGISDDANSKSEQEIFANLNLAMEETIILLKKITDQQY